ncbi:MAG: UDP-glucose--hexose-1-phosphate uridylyltransferase, partial [Oscillospiraceae bacterium]|nr:UDP-glucose--hexose-1-phosphate uridylyltransferase [Oscillospiraceae bacterium]
EIERLLHFAQQKGMIDALDKIVARNTLLDLFGLAQPDTEVLPEEDLQYPTQILDNLLDAAGEQGLFDKDVDALRTNFEARIMGAVMPRESEVAKTFAALKAEKGICAATDYFYNLCLSSNYIRTAQIAKNIKWDYACKYGNLEITINLTKPEKDPKTIALERLQPAASYPKCMLCVDNIGYAGRVNFPARQTHRIVPIRLGEETWYLQYSPYVYYNEHCIIFSEKHEPMQINAHTFEQIFAFVQQFPHYTCGSNADLPIVGGSILSHTHFQGGRYTFPMQKASVRHAYKSEKYADISVYSINWPVSTVRATGESVPQLLAFAVDVLTVWQNYDDEAADILAFSQQDGKKVPHNTITPIIHYKAGTGYIMDLVPRNNRTSKEHPLGIFHPHAEIHHIKKENIGLIEVMGLAILPARLKVQTAQIALVLQGKAEAKQVAQEAAEHADWISYLVEKYGTALSEAASAQVLNNEIGLKFETCLEHAGVFKGTPEGIEAYDRFLKKVGCTRL